MRIDNDKKYHKCCQCGKRAVWFKEISNKHDLVYYCDDCVPRGSIDNINDIENYGEPNVTNSGGKVMWWDKNSSENDIVHDGSLDRTENSFYYEVLDNKGRRFPSDVYSFCKDGFLHSEDETIFYLKYYDVRETLRKTFYKLPPNLKMDIEDDIEMLFDRKHVIFDEFTIEYNTFMNAFNRIIFRIVDHDLYKSKINGTVPKYDCLRKFWFFFRDEIRKVKTKQPFLIV